MIQAETRVRNKLPPKNKKQKKKKSRIAEPLEEEETLSWDSSESNKRQQQSFFLTSEICNGDQDVGGKHTEWSIDRWIDVLEHKNKKKAAHQQTVSKAKFVHEDPTNDLLLRWKSLIFAAAAPATARAAAAAAASELGRQSRQTRTTRSLQLCL